MIQSSEYIRKLIHLFNLIIPAGYIFLIPEKYTFLTILSVFTILSLVLDIGRMRVDAIRTLFDRFLNYMLRGHELDGHLTGATWAMIGALITILLFPQNIAVLSLLFVCFGDIVAALIGMRFGSHKIGEKSWEGFLGGLVTCLLVAWVYPFLPFRIGAIGAMGAMMLEIMPIPLDDNFKMPLGAGSIMLLFSPFL